MLKQTLLAIAIPAALITGTSHAAEIYNKDGNKLDFYGKIVGEHTWKFDKKNNNNDSSYARIGLKGETQINDQLSGYGQWEYNMDASASEGNQETKVRKAFAGLKFAQYGSFDYGRKDGVVYDAEAATDNFVFWGGDGWNAADLFMTGRNSGVATYRNQDLFGMVNGLDFALQYQGKRESDAALHKQNGDGFSTSVSYALPIDVKLVAAYATSNRTLAQKVDKKGNKAEAAAISATYDANNIYAAVMYAQTYNLVPQENKAFANKTYNFEALVQYLFDFGLQPSIGYLQSTGQDLEATGTFKGGKADLQKYIEVGAWYYFNKNMNVYAAYKFNLLKKDDYSRSIGLSTDDELGIGIAYQF